jgi:hypothetical protein
MSPLVVWSEKPILLKTLDTFIKEGSTLILLRAAAPTPGGSRLGEAPDRPRLVVPSVSIRPASIFRPVNKRTADPG